MTLFQDSWIPYLTGQILEAAIQEIGTPVRATGKVQAGQSFIQNDTELSFFMFYLILKKMKLYECQKPFQI